MFESGGGSCSARTKLFIATIRNAACRNKRASHLLAGFWGTAASATQFCFGFCLFSTAIAVLPHRGFLIPLTTLTHGKHFVQGILILSIPF